MRLEPTLLVDAASRHDETSSLERRVPLSRRALLAAALAGGVSAGVLGWLDPPGRRLRGSEWDSAAPDLEPWARGVAELRPAQLIALHATLAFVGARGLGHSEVIDRAVLRLLDAVLADPGTQLPEPPAALRAEAAVSLCILARLPGAPAELVDALPRLEAIR